MEKIIKERIEEINERADKYIQEITDKAHQMRTTAIINGKITNYMWEMERIMDNIRTYQSKLTELDARILEYKRIAIEMGNKEILIMIQDTDDRIQKFIN